MPMGMDQPPPVGGPAAPPGAGPGAAPSPVLPKSPVGGPGGPGASPMMSPGGGAGNQAAAVQRVKGILPMLLETALAWPVGSKEQRSLVDAFRSLSSAFGKGDQSNVPAGIAAMAMNAQKGGGMTAAPPPGIKPTNTPPPGMDIPSGAMEEAA
jgi:hypothetical protein